MILASDFDGALREAERLRDIFGKDSFYLELQDHGMPEQKKVNRALLEISGRSGIPLVATNDVHYIRRSDAGAQRVLMAIAMQSTADEVGFGGEEHYFKSEAEMAQLFSSYGGAIENTVAIAERCSYDFDFSSTYLPRYVPEDGSELADAIEAKTVPPHTASLRMRRGHFCLCVFRLELHLDSARSSIRHTFRFGAARSSAVGSTAIRCTVGHAHFIPSLSRKNCPVKDSGQRATSSGVPLATIRPPPSPPSIAR